MLGRGNDLIVNIVGDSSGLSRAYTKAQQQTTTYVAQSQRAGQRLKSKGLFALQAASALGLQQHVDVAAETIAEKLGVGSTAASALGSSTELLVDLGIESKTARKLIGKAGLAGAVGFASFEMASMILNATGLDKKLEGLGKTAYNTATSLGFIHDPMKQFEGKTNPTQRLARSFMNQAARLEAGGLTPQQAADRLAAANPSMAKRDLEVWAGVYGKKPVVIENNLYLDGAKVSRSVSTHQTRAASHAARQTSGRHG